MPTIRSTHCLAACAMAATLALTTAAHGASKAAFTNADPASAAASAAAAQPMKFDTRRHVPATLTLRREAPAANGWKAQYRFAGQTDLHDCTFELPKSGQSMQRGEPTTGTIVCSTPWQLSSSGMAFDVLENGQKVGDGTLRP